MLHLKTPPPNPSSLHTVIANQRQQQQQQPQAAISFKKQLHLWTTWLSPSNFVPRHKVHIALICHIVLRQQLHILAMSVFFWDQQKPLVMRFFVQPECWICFKKNLERFFVRNLRILYWKIYNFNHDIWGSKLVFMWSYVRINPLKTPCNRPSLHHPPGWLSVLRWEFLEIGERFQGWMPDSQYHP